MGQNDSDGQFSGGPKVPGFNGPGVGGANPGTAVVNSADLATYKANWIWSAYVDPAAPAIPATLMCILRLGCGVGANTVNTLDAMLNWNVVATAVQTMGCTPNYSQASAPIELIYQAQSFGIGNTLTTPQYDALIIQLGWKDTGTVVEAGGDGIFFYKTDDIDYHTLVLKAAGYTPCIITDIGKMVIDDGGNTGALLAYNNTARTWRVADNLAMPILINSVITLGGGGIGRGAAFAQSTPVMDNRIYAAVSTAAAGGNFYAEDTGVLGVKGEYHKFAIIIRTTAEEADYYIDDVLVATIDSSPASANFWPGTGPRPCEISVDQGMAGLPLDLNFAFPFIVLQR